MAKDTSKVLAGALFFIKDNVRTLIMALLWPTIVLTLIDLTFYLELGFIYSFVFELISFIIQVIFAITIHRLVLLGPASLSRWGIVRWTWIETKFLIRFVVLSFAIFIPIILLVSTIPGIIVGALLALLLASRLSLVFPAIAIDKRMSFIESWRLTKNHFVLMMTVIVLLPILFGATVYIFQFMPYGYFLSIPLYLLFIVYEVVALSLSYHLIIDESKVDAEGTNNHFND
ncbi:hypothetical protein QWI17_09830 [Gilvimarinus sp. SDUM040013]|uniref:Glycerophosphoryl diester phosphodiesterase membrane domain-containing protein n=1 Tax=Gilvimarinus gilvus TaxID=3058038 RepID=A0ABU4S2U6_9GAMM|nr:hypothetical protein [Gilvimarinus sp. SDUM040013]MDO3386134.1 hypothetical protein [Gilvimarinus sp. SDUM040013]MDX6851475.1 hypothetical protein [Gilvimarinus sp. SDUM040013]